MDVPALDDTMEMASPYQGHVDDFEIDLDVMEDQVSNPDKDMTIANDGQHPSNNMDYNHPGNDMDMVDEVAERAMVDADDQNPDAADLHYGDEVYEADMAEDNYDEDIDAPVPDVEGEDLPVSLEDTSQQVGEQGQPADRNDLVQETHRESVVENTVETWGEHADEHAEETLPASKQGEDHITRTVSREAESNQTQQEPVDGGFEHTNSTERVDAQQAHLVGDEVEDIEAQHHDSGRAIEEGKSRVVDPKDRETQEVEKKKVHEQTEREPDTSYQEAALHALKVYYQDNEISLFPPREGDSSEMFLLEDESLAYENFGRLFDSCREVLQGSIGENELLLVDIESLNIQLTEVCLRPLSLSVQKLTAQDSPDVSQVTLSQIIDLYVRLCQNEHIAHPEPLYLALSTKLTIPAQLSDLLTAANEGKGISDVQPWDDYEEVAPPSIEDRDRPPNKEPDHVVPEQETSADQEVSKETEPVLALENGREEQELEGDVESAGNEGEGALSAPDAEEHHDHEAEEPEDDIQEPNHPEAGHRTPNEGSYDSEAQRTESTATITQHLTGEQYVDSHHGESHNIEEAAAETHTGHVADGEYKDTGEAANAGDDHPEQPVDDEYHDPEDEDAGEIYDTEHHEASGAEANAAAQLEDPEGEPPGEDVDNDPLSEYPAENWQDGGVKEGEDYPEEEFEDEEDAVFDKNSESREGNLPHDSYETQVQDNLDATHEELGVSEDAGPPAEETAHVEEEAEDQLEDGEQETTDSHAIPDDPDDWNFDEDLDLGVADPFEAGRPGTSHADSEAHENVPSKRTREPEGEVEVDETPVPDPKRRRSS